jgi:hypothetical protein
MAWTTSLPTTGSSVWPAWRCARTRTHARTRARTRTCIRTCTQSWRAKARQEHKRPTGYAACAWQKLVDCISSVWSQYDALEHETLGAVVVVLEGCGLHVVSADWGDGEEPMAYPVTPLDESLAPYFA